MTTQTTPVDVQKIGQIMDRIAVSAEMYEIKLDRTSLYMDLLNTHKNSCALDLQGLLDADDDDFEHDVFGIMEHMDRENSALRDDFVPRLTLRN